MKQQKISCLCGCGNTKNRYTKNGEETFYIRNHDKRGTNHHNWKGGRYPDKNGYIYIYKPNHPYANTNGYVMEHRLIMEKHIGRYLTKDEHVHHIDHDPQNNNLNNLLLLSSSEHALLHNEEHRLKNIVGRKCKECDSDRSYSNKWFIDKIDNKYRCRKCYERIRRRNKKLSLIEIAN